MSDREMWEKAEEHFKALEEQEAWKIDRLGARVAALNDLLTMAADRITQLETAIRTGGAMLRAVRATLGVPGGHLPLEPSSEEPKR